MVTVGVDLHKRTAQIAVLTPEGEVAQHHLDTNPQQIAQFFSQLPPHTSVAIEASATWWWLVDLLETLGHQPRPSHPKQTKAIAATRLKNDRVDGHAWPCCFAPTCCPRSGFRPHRCGRLGSCFDTASA